MTDDFLTGALTALNERLAGQYFVRTVSLRITDIGSILIEGHSARISDARADCAIIASAQTLEAILQGDLHPMKAVLFGKMKIAGDTRTAMQFGALFG